MTAKEYILVKLEELIAKFPNLRARYEYDRGAEVHFVEIVPNEVYCMNETYVLWENEAVCNFIELFPTQNICFISDDALVGIRNVEYSFEGLAYAPLSAEPQLITLMSQAASIKQKVALGMAGDITSAERMNGDIFVEYQIPPSPTYRLAA